MPKFEVLRRVDAYADYVAVIEASSPEEAAKRAADAEEQFAWKPVHVAEFDARLFVALDENGHEIADTQCGDF